MQPARYTVSEATAMVQTCLDEGLVPLWVEGEISNFVAHRSGHFYFSLKDADAQLRGVMFRGLNQRLRFRPADGQQVVAFGRIRVYVRGGQYQLIVERMLPVGEGALQAAFQALKARLAAEGLFAPERKRRLPAYPEVVAVATSADGAAIRDIERVLRRRWPAVRLLLRPTRVQGAGAAEEIAAAIGAINRRDDVDVLIVGRGGGSLEDLWAFNEEVTARAIAGSRIPTVSAVGHEIDETIADYVADLRAPTPSAAAELVAPDVREALGALQRNRDRCTRALRQQLRELRLRLDAVLRSAALRSPTERLQQTSQRSDELLQRASRAIAQRLDQVRQRLAHAGDRIEALGPGAVLGRGYALAFDAQGRLVPRVRGRRPGEELRLRMADGELRCTIASIHPQAEASGLGHAGTPRGRHDE